MTAMIDISNAEKTFTMHLQGGVELQRLVAGDVEHREDAGDGEPAAHRRRDVDLAKRRYQTPHAITDKQDDAGKRHGLNEIEGDGQHLGSI